jgi:hypothetical protein
MGERNENLVYPSPRDFKSSLTCRKILRRGIFPLYFPSERKACCGFLSPLNIHRLGRVRTRHLWVHYTTKATDFGNLWYIFSFIVFEQTRALDIDSCRDSEESQWKYHLYACCPASYVMDLIKSSSILESCFFFVLAPTDTYLQK